MYKIGIDVGGTFTDFVVAGEGGQPRFFKTQSTPDDPSIGVMTGLQEAAAAYGLSLDRFAGRHGPGDPWIDCRDQHAGRTERGKGGAHHHRWFP